jgi:hypothetical protein
MHVQMGVGIRASKGSMQSMQGRELTKAKAHEQGMQQGWALGRVRFETIPEQWFIKGGGLIQVDLAKTNSSMRLTGTAQQVDRMTRAIQGRPKNGPGRARLEGRSPSH